MSELTNLSILQLSRVSVNSYVKTVGKYPLYLKRADFLKILSVPSDHCESRDNFIKFSKNYTLHDFFKYIQILAFASIVLRLTTRKHILMI